MRQSEYQFLIDYCFGNLYPKQRIPKELSSLWSFRLEDQTVWFNTEDDLLEYLDAGNNNGFLSRYDYLESFLGENDVIMKSQLLFVDDELLTSYVSFETKADDGNLKILCDTNDGYFWQEYIKVEDFDDIMNEFKKIGINKGFSYSLKFKN